MLLHLREHFLVKVPVVNLEMLTGGVWGGQGTGWPLPQLCFQLISLPPFPLEPPKISFPSPSGFKLENSGPMPPLGHLVSLGMSGRGDDQP